MSCKSCGCDPCSCQPAALANVSINGGTINGVVINGPTINSGEINDADLNAVQIDLASRGVTAAQGVCNDGIATNAFVCNEIDARIDSGNADFCNAVAGCLAGDSSMLCPTVAFCITTTPGIINNTNAFGVGARATTAVFGVTRYASQNQFNAGDCGVSFEPCKLVQALAFPSLASAFWTAFSSAVTAVISGSASFCAAVTACAPTLFNNAALTGTPTAPTAALGTNSTQIATTAFVQQELANQISSTNPAFCAAVTACGGGGGGSCASIVPSWTPAGGSPGGAVRFLADDCQSYTAAQIGGGVSVVVKGIVQVVDNGLSTSVTAVQLQSGCAISLNNPVADVVFAAPFSDNNYQINISTTNGFTASAFLKSTTGFSIAAASPGIGHGQIYFEIFA